MSGTDEVENCLACSSSLMASGPAVSAAGSSAPPAGQVSLRRLTVGGDSGRAGVCLPVRRAANAEMLLELLLELPELLELSELLQSRRSTGRELELDAARALELALPELPEAEAEAEPPPLLLETAADA